jgi:hypothetical protein
MRLFSEFASDPKVQSMPETLQRRLVMLWCLRCQGDLSGLTDREIAHGLRIPLKDLEKTRAVFLEKGFMEPDWSLPKWEARQLPKDPTAAERMRNYRRRQGERNRNVTSNGDSPARERQGSAEHEEQEGARALRNVTPPNPNPDPDPTATAAPAVRAPPDPDPADAEAVRLGLQLGGSSWGAWVRRMIALNYPAAWIADVMRKLHGRGTLKEGLAYAILEEYRRQGGPDRRPREGATDRPAAPTAEPRKLGDIKPRLPEGPAGESLRKLWEAIEGKGGGDPS